MNLFLGSILLLGKFPCVWAVNAHPETPESISLFVLFKTKIAKLPFKGLFFGYFWGDMNNKLSLRSI